MKTIFKEQTIFFLYISKEIHQFYTFHTKIMSIVDGGHEI